MKILGRPHAGQWLALTLLWATCGCDERSKQKETSSEAPAPTEESASAPAPAPRSAPTFGIDEVGPKVGYSRAMLTTADDKPDPRGQKQLKEDLQAERDFITDKEVTLAVDRKAKPAWVSEYLAALSELKPAKITIETETRKSYPEAVEFVPEADAEAPSCTLVGTITDDRGTAIWRVSGGTARKRGRGMGGPDLTMTGDTIESMAKGCESDLFVVTGARGVEWGMIYDLAASALSLEKAGLVRAIYPRESLTAGHAVEL